MSQLQEKYATTVVPVILKEFGYTNKLAAPRIEAVILNVGLSKALQDKKFIDVAVRTLTKITGQKPILTTAKKSISNFKIREGMTVGAKVTLRGKKMYDFLDKLVHIAFPRMRDFHGLDPTRGFDQHGNYSVGFREHLVFPEIPPDDVEDLHGLEVAIKTTAKSPAEALYLLQQLGFPFKKK